MFGHLSRRGFMAQATGGLLAAGLPLWFAQEVVATELSASVKKTSANDKLRIGLVGTGDRCKQVISPLLSRQDCVITAVCDADANHMDEVARMVAGERVSRATKDKPAKVTAEADAKKMPTKIKDYRDLCSRNDIDAVIVVTPDHWHALPAIAACKNKKDVYCEKPLSLTVEEGRAMVTAAKANQRVFQTGSQQRSEMNGRFRLAVELVRNGRIGTIQKIETRIGGAPKGGPFKEAPVPTELDWDLWLGPTPKVPYVREKCHYTFRWFYAYSGGKGTDWGAHHNDVAQWALDMDNSGPVSVAATGVVESPLGGYDAHTKFEITYKYANGVPVICKSDGENGVLFVGDKGTIFVSRGTIRATNANGEADKKIIEEPLPSSAVRVYNATNHMNNFLECIRTRKPAICDVEIGHRSCTVCHLGNIALRFAPGKTLAWKPDVEQFGEAEFNQHLSRPMRGPWKLDA